MHTCKGLKVRVGTIKGRVQAAACLPRQASGEAEAKSDER